jgi:hypothetical protein
LKKTSLKELERECKTFEGFVNSFCYLWHGTHTIKRFTKDKNKKILLLHTAGLSENEKLVSELEQTLFWFLFWEVSVRGGHYTFVYRPNKEIPKKKEILNDIISNDEDLARMKLIAEKVKKWPEWKINLSRADSCSLNKEEDEE